MTTVSRVQRAFAGVLAAALSFAWLPAAATPLALSQQPLFLQVPQKPNLIVTLDDSGSMASAYVPDEYGNLMVTSGYSYKAAFSSDANAMYYNPATKYVPPLKADGTSYSTSFTAAWYNGFDTTQGSVDLSKAYRPTETFNPTGTLAQANHPNDLTALGASSTTAGTKAYYYTLNSGCTATVSVPSYPSMKVPADSCFTLNQVTSTSPADVQQNFANWYSFYRTRNLSVASSATLAFAQLDGGVRVAWQSINKCAGFDDACAGRTSTTYKNKIRRFETNKTDFYSWLSRLPASGSTPMRSALKRVGSYVMNQTLGDGDVYAYDPNVTGKANPKYSCRATYAILMTDGLWNVDSGFSVCSGTTLGGCSSDNLDGTSYTLPDGTSYTAMNPYQDGTATANNLSDVAFAFWSRDLRPDIADNVPRRTATSDPTMAGPDSATLAKWTTAQYWDPANDPANWQHLTTYAIGLGLQKGLPTATPPLTWDPTVGTFGGSYPAIAAGTTTWPVVNPLVDNAAKIGDLWHTAIDGRGRFYAAESSADIVKAFAEIISSINTSVAAAGAAAANSQSFAAGSATYLSVYHPNSSPKLDPMWSGLTTGTAQLWWGDLQKVPFVKSSPTAPLTLSTTPAWSAAVNLIHDASVVATPNKYVNARTILTYDPSKTGAAGAIPFRWANISATQQSTITGAASTRTGSDRLNWIRGDATNEGDYNTTTTLGGLRARPVTKLGDIVYSSPVLVAQPHDGLADPSYAAFRSAMSSRQPMIYVGANDGMLHGFRESDGVEMMAYVPSEVYASLRQLTEPSYPHHAYVDGHLQVNDAQFSDGWHSVLIGGLRAGGIGYFALDVTTPSFSESSPSTTVLWEFNSKTDATNLGYSYGRPVIAKLNNGKWAAIFGNGYNSTSGKAGLYVAYIEAGKTSWVSGTNFKFIDTGAAVGASPNGLSSPAVADIDGNGTADYVYAGDLYGNMWKFDLTGDMSTWGAPKKIFSAVDGSGKAQPITTAPEVSLHPMGGYMVFFGTGKAVEDTDVADTSVQSFYGVWDSASTDTVTRARMLQHVFTPTVTRTTTNATTGKVYKYDLRTVDTATPTWWDPVTHPAGQLGWYIDLMEAPPPSTTLVAIGERVIEDPQLLDGKILFVSATPTNDPCNGGGQGWINEIDAITGSRLPVPPFDLNEDGSYDDADRMESGGRNPASRRVSPVGGLPLVVRDKSLTPGASTGACVDYKVIKRSDGTTEMIADPCTASTGRLNWRDLSR